MKGVRNLKLSVNFIKHGKRFVAYSPALDISTVGTSEADARNKFEEIVEIFFEEVHEAGTTGEALSDLGWKKVRKQWQPPEVSKRSVGVNIPTLA